MMRVQIPPPPVTHRVIIRIRIWRFEFVINWYRK